MTKIAGSGSVSQRQVSADPSGSGSTPQCHGSATLQVAIHLASLRSASSPSLLSPRPSSSTPTTSGSGASNSPGDPDVSAGPVVVGGSNFDLVVQVLEEITLDGSSHSGRLHLRPVNQANYLNVAHFPSLFSVEAVNKEN
jgi:hypothetical protein